MSITFSEDVGEAGDNITSIVALEAATLELFRQSILLPDLVQVFAIIRDLHITFTHFPSGKIDTKM